MLKKSIFKLLLIFLYIELFFSFSLSYEVSLPNSVATSNSDVVLIDNKVKSDNGYYIKISKTINDYLWFFLGSVAFGVVLYAGFLLLTSNGSDEDLKKGNKMLVWGLVGIFVSLFSYTIIKLLIGLF